MYIFNRSPLLFLCLSLMLPAALAQQIDAPSKAQRQGMSYEEYTDFREKMRLRMEKMRADHRNQSAETDPHPHAEKEKHDERAYGKGFDSRNRDNDRPDTARPDRPRVERFNRHDRMHR